MKELRPDRTNRFAIVFVFLLLLGLASKMPAEERRTGLDPLWIDPEAERWASDDAIDRLTSDELTFTAGGDGPAAGRESYLSQMWELDESKPRGQYVLMAHRSNYLLPFTYNDHPNVDPIRHETGQNVLESEATFQISQKIKLWQDVLGRNMDLWMGYTQRSFWQVYNTADSSPFRETNYEPEVLLNFRTDFPISGMRARTITLGLNHQSNGRSEPLSRSWNRIVGNVGFERGDFTLLLQSWYRIPESAEEDDNPDIEDYMGYGEIWGYYLWKKHRFGMMLRNNLRFDDNRGALQLEWSFPLVRRVSGYVQFFTGYGESLLDYNHSTNRIGIGFILRDWN